MNTHGEKEEGVWCSPLSLFATLKQTVVLLFLLVQERSLAKPWYGGTELPAVCCKMNTVEPHCCHLLHRYFFFFVIPECVVLVEKVCFFAFFMVSSSLQYIIHKLIDDPSIRAYTQPTYLVSLLIHHLVQQLHLYLVAAFLLPAVAVLYLIQKILKSFSCRKRIELLGLLR